MIFFLLCLGSDSDRHRRATSPSTLYVFRSGDFLVVPTGQAFNADKQTFHAKREKLRFNLRWCHVGQLPFIKTLTFCFLPVLVAWLTRRRFTMLPDRATIMRKMLTDNGWNLIYVKDDKYRVSFFRSKRLRVRFFRKLPSMTFCPADCSKLNHTTFTGFDIYFNVKK